MKTRKQTIGLRTLFILLLISTQQLFAQDTLFFKVGAPMVVNILKETSSKVYVLRFADSSSIKEFTICKKKLNEIRYHNDSARFAAMTPNDFYNLGKKHAKELDVQSSKIIWNDDYLRGFKENKKGVKKTLKDISSVVGVF